MLRYLKQFAQPKRHWHKKAGELFEGHKTCRHGLEQDNKNSHMQPQTNKLLQAVSNCASTHSKGKKMFHLSDYDCVGFDLDNTILRYRVSNMVQLEYDLLSKYLVEEKGHNAAYLLKPISSDIGFLQKGLALDFVNGNVVQIGINGYILKASHGTRRMSDTEIEEYYGVNRIWDIAKCFTENMLEGWNGLLSERIRCLLDSFDMPASLVFARIVDSLDSENGGKLDAYNVWPDVLDGLIDMFNREHFALNKGGYFSALKANPDKYIDKCSLDVIGWLREMKKTKIVFLLTGSNVDFASFTAKHALGDDWRSFFDIVICYARKPGFFTGTRPFLQLDGIKESTIVEGLDLQLNGSIYSQGNWKELYQLLSKETNKDLPKCLYFGDNLIQDVYTPSECLKCDTVAVVEELAAEEYIIPNLVNMLNVSKYWGSYFYAKSSHGEKAKGNTMWDAVIRKYSKICIPDLDVLAVLPLDYKIPCFEQNGVTNGIRPAGYFPSNPVSITLSNIDTHFVQN